MYLVAGILIALLASQSDQKPEWCRALPRPEYSKLERVNIPDKWFEVYRIRPGLFAIYEPHQQEEIISYLIVGEKRALLFDTGMGISNIRKVVEELTQLPVSVMNSHTHNDHVSDNWQFSRIYGMDTAFTREHAKGTVAAAQEEIGPGAICGALPAGFDARSYAVKPFHITDWIHGGEKIDLGGRILEVISTPGHTPDSISLWDAQNGLLFTGDMYYPGPIFLFRPETDLNAYEASIKKMASLKAKLLLTAHNIAVGDPADLPRVLAAMQQVRSGKIKPVRNGETWEYKFQGFSFLMKEQLATGN
ncbi:MAG TPA: MBL fold metallo-hydrolase [Verrucomicrobiae bacterium]|jgi:glyoxylase-like metal-dependent hydrolase (beta-lactamase superfamily II)|nr:MBL fold metallo-hydrolase [Verrucomicrobiae bacterium]